MTGHGSARKTATGVACREIPGSTTDLGEGEHDAPHLTLVTKTIFADDLEFRVPAIGVNLIPST